jgi:hypothetical protein
MLTPAEELGLSGMSLAGRVRKALYRIPEPELRRLMERVRDESLRRHLIYMRDGAEETINLLTCPLTALPDQLAYIHSVSLTLHRALKRFPGIYRTDFGVRDTLRISPGEEEWLWSCWGRSHEESDPVFGRLDALVDLTSPTWKESLRFVEPNMSGIGGLHLVPTCERIIGEVILPVLRAEDNQLQLEIGPDIRELLMQEVLDHLQLIGRPARNICFVEPKHEESGTDEQEALAWYFQERYGLTVQHADPRELALQDREVYCAGAPVDLAYRDCSVSELLKLAKEGADVEPMRALFEQNRIISSITAELDQKSCWEVLTDPAVTHRYFTADERQVFRRHLLWTRILSDRQTLLPDGQSGDLLEYARREHELLVLKPNRSFGGDGVLLGHSMTRPDWESAIEKALQDQQRWVVQQLAGIPVYEFPVVGPGGKLQVEPFHTVLGFSPTKDGLSILGRASQKQVVNIAQRGGMCAVVVGHPPGGLMGPG